MKISASIYSDKENKNNIMETIQALNDSHVDLIHVDCNDDLNVFADIEKIQQNTDIPVDLHIITPRAERFYSALEQFDIDFVNQINTIPKVKELEQEEWHEKLAMEAAQRAEDEKSAR